MLQKLFFYLTKCVILLSLLCFSTLSIAQPFNSLNFKSDQMEELVGMWSHDMENDTKSMVVEFKRNGSFEMVIYDRFNIKTFDMAIGEYLIKDGKIYTVFYDVIGTKNLFKLNQLTESELILVNEDQLILKDTSSNAKDDASTKIFKLMSRRAFNEQDMI